MALTINLDRPYGLRRLSQVPSMPRLGGCLGIRWYIEECNVNFVEASRRAHTLFNSESWQIFIEASFEDDKHDSREEVVEQSCNFLDVLQKRL